MIKVKFRNKDKAYWAICEKLSYIKGNGYLLENIQESSLYRGPQPWTKLMESWEMISVKEA